MTKICLVAGGSGGHIIPALTLGKRWLKANPGGRVDFICSNKKLDREILEKSGAQLDMIVSLGAPVFPGKRFWLYPKMFMSLVFCMIRAFFFLRRERPIKIISTGGYVAVPACLSAWLLRLPVEIYELNVIPGIATRVLAPFANKVYVVFDKTKKLFHGGNNNPGKYIKCDYPIRYEDHDRSRNKKDIIDKINLNLTRPFSISKKTIFLLGGSQGSVYLNTLFRKWIKNNFEKLEQVQVIHQTGESDSFDWKTFYENLSISHCFFSYQDDLRDFYLLADFVISRGGAGTLAELAFFKKKSLIFPLRGHAANHQQENLRERIKEKEGLFLIGSEEVFSSLL
jgi:UDP-N-acetylglucosamine--N-acetylmuramyl-(pentapeptide) pyrophosphoryl-undecaprenol N-acetylglucosamine transferase